MPRYPDAIWKPIPRYQPGGSVHEAMPNPRRLCFHTAVSSGDSLFALFNQSGNPVAHFYVREDGTIEQYVDTDTRASANLEGNPDTISVESWDGGHERDWTGKQVEACAHLAAWVHDKHGIPLDPCDASPGSRGVTWHRKGIDGNFPAGLLSGRRAGDEHWSLSAGKTCPYDAKIRGVVDAIIPRARQLATGGDWFDMATKAELREVVDAALQAERDNQAAAVWSVGIGPEGSVEEARDRLRGADFQATSAASQIAALAAAFEDFRTGTRNRHDALMGKLTAIAADTSDDATKTDLLAAVEELKNS